MEDKLKVFCYEIEFYGTEFIPEGVYSNTFTSDDDISSWTNVDLGGKYFSDYVRLAEPMYRTMK